MKTRIVFCSETTFPKGWPMPKRKQRGSLRSASSSVRTGLKTSIGNDVATLARKAVRPVLVKPFHVAVDRQLKSEYDSYHAAEKAALELKKQHPKLHVTVFDAKERRHALIELPTTANGRGDSTHNRRGNGSARRKLAVAEVGS